MIQKKKNKKFVCRCKKKKEEEKQLLKSVIRECDQFLLQIKLQRYSMLRMMLWRSPSVRFPVRVITSQQSHSFTRENIPDWTIQRLCSKASQPLTSFYPPDRGITGAVPTLLSGFKVHRKRGDNDQ
ncbi:hypothetical protein TNCV_4642611 [Trichonephila clavipes]|nr:hypothetical protein TNCV_4642611 [Trichonephila clavipes]